MKVVRYRQFAVKVLIAFLFICLLVTSVNPAENAAAQDGYQSTPQTQVGTPTPTQSNNQQNEETGPQLDSVEPTLTDQIDYNSLYATAENDLWRISPNTGTFVYVGPIGHQGTDIAFDGKKLYGINFSQLLSIDPITGSGSVVGNIGYNDVNALVVSRDGTMYAGTVSGALLRINKSTGAGTLVGYYGAGLGSSGDLAIRTDNIMYASVTRSGYSTDWLAQIDINTGRATLIGNIGYRGVYGMDAKDWVLYGVTANGDLLKIDVSTGWGTRIAWTSAPFWGLAVSGIKPPPLVIVHGFQGLSDMGGYHCSNDGIGSNDIQEYDGSNPNLSTLGSLPDWFLSGHRVYIAHLESTPSSTPSLVTNAKCLSDQLDYVASQNPNWPITIVSHSMGGLVSRAALYYVNSNTKVKAIYTLGSPHAGFPFDALQLIYGVVEHQPAVYNMSESYMGFYNWTYKNKTDVEYYFIGGNGTWGGYGPLVLPFVGSNDGLVGKYSAMGWIWPLKINNPLGWTSNSSKLGQYWTDEFHVSGWGWEGNSYYDEPVSPPNQIHSDAFECMTALMKNGTPDQAYCKDATNLLALSPNLELNETSITSVFTELKNGHLNAAQSISIPLSVDTSATSRFYLTWSGAEPTFSLTRPDTQIIDQSYAATHPAEVTYENFFGGAEVPSSQIYKFDSTQQGVWQLNITAVDALEYQAFATFDSSRTLTSQTDKDSYQVGETTVLTATLDSGGTGLSGATVTANLTRPDDVVETIILIDQGNGSYTNNYIIPDTPGFLTIDVIATGSDNGTAFSRQENLLVSITPNDLQLTGNYGDQPRDDNSDGFHDFLDFTAEVNLATAGEYAVSAELYSDDQLITQSGGFFNLAIGPQTITLPFDGGAIREAGLDGPYVVKNLNFTSLGSGIAAASVENVWTTEAYPYIVFADKMAPAVSSITRNDPNPTTAASVNFTVSFSEPVTNVDVDDFIPTTTGIVGAYVTNVSGSSAGYTVTVNTGFGNGTIRLNVADDNTIVDWAGNLLGGINIGDGDFTSGETYKIIKTPTFSDVPLNYWSWGYVERLVAAGVTAGCGGGNYCPTTTVTRDQMAVFLLKGKHGSGYVPPPQTGVFSDVPTNYWAATWIEQLAAEGITAGCGGGNYCPTTPVTRDQMAVFLLKAKHGSSYIPPTPTGVFLDVPTNYWAAAWIEQLAAEGITAGCGGGNYCPTTPVTRDQMAVFLVKNFDLP